ncbi:hypothetical protein [Archangium lansingense]|uniref:Uncharacterized protein n=1 Tax=Archangium lansingense TaxID=2995310 RepID=A0ABT3ZXE6_9BACT|nr:hypothetical protein [Archangium lansinium]MCY1074068.1 hypothetical protein [Archangium lansinium]
MRTKPLIVAVQGLCFTLGIELILAADIAVAYRRERSHVEGEGRSGGAEKGRCRSQQGRAPRRYTGRYNPLGHTPALAALA